ncbi:transposase family protein [Actinomadura miaoliensis]|uniref:Transposase IS204/IS1001/IS1096/IS1165 zinc-finger domain-containing protein n=1 Tax=Actinomadura miaoliensis TaxID=430685 RepID=A0ABP7UZD7_9ACTN
MRRRATEACCLHLFCPALKDLRVLDVVERGDTVRIAARTSATEASCPKCGVSSARVHSRYRRKLWDLAACGGPLMIALEVRRFFCGEPACEREIFAEQIDGLAERHPRRTGALRGLDRGGPGWPRRCPHGRHGRRAGGPTCRSTLPRMLRALPDPQVG